MNKGYINQKAICQLKEIHDRCFFSTTKESKYFWKKVCEAAGVNQVKHIRESKFQAALDQAESLLYQTGYDIFKDLIIPRRRTANA